MFFCRLGYTVTMHLKYNVRPNEAIGQSVTWVHKFLTTGFTIVSQMSFRYLGEALFFDLAETIILLMKRWSHTHTQISEWIHQNVPKITTNSRSFPRDPPLKTLMTKCSIWLLKLKCLFKRIRFRQRIRLHSPPALSFGMSHEFHIQFCSYSGKGFDRFSASS